MHILKTIMDLFTTKVAYASLDSFIASVNHNILNPLIILLFGLAIVYFLYGALQFFGNQENEENRTNGKNHMIWGIIGLVIMMGVFTLLNIVMDTFNLDDGQINPQTGEVHLNDYSPSVDNQLE